MSGLLSTTLTGSMEAICVGPVEADSGKISCHNSEPTHERLLPSDPSGPDSKDKHHANPSSTAQSEAGTENDPSVSNIVPNLPRTERRSLSSPNAQSRHISTTRTDGEKSKTGATCANAVKSEHNTDKTGAPLPRTESVKRKSSAEEEAKTKNQDGSAPPAPAVKAGEEEVGIRSSAASVGRATFFVKDWEFVQTLGEGAYGE